MPKLRRRPAVDATIRLVKLMALLPRAPQKISTRQLRDRMADDGMDVTLRSIQRDLMRLSAHFAITSDGAKPEAGWQWIKGAAELSFPGMDDRSALAWMLAGQYLDSLLPNDIKASLQPRFDAAKKVLAQTPFARTRRWAERVIAKPRGFQLLPPKVEPGVPEAVQQALLDRKRLHIHYLRPSDNEPTEAEISVLGLVVRGSVTYLVTVFWGYDDPRLLVMHRIKAAKVLDMSSREPKSFDFASFVSSGALDWPLGPPTALKGFVTSDLARILAETPLATDQTIDHHHARWWLVQATVEDSMDLRSWIASVGRRFRSKSPKAASRHAKES